MMGALVDYYFYTGDDRYTENMTTQWLSAVGPGRDLQPLEEASSEGNDDQAFWAMFAMEAAERGLPDPPRDKNAGYLALAQTVFNIQAGRWDNATCGGGLRWQTVSARPDYNYKNSISNGLFFLLGARLARYTNNQTYADLADRTYKWVENIGLIDSNFVVYDGAVVNDQCGKKTDNRWTYNYGVFLAGAAFMYNFTNGSPYWEARVSGLLNSSIQQFFDPATQNTIMYEWQCETSMSCNLDQASFKAYLSRWMAITTQVAPFTAVTILPLLASSARAAAASCIGTSGSSNSICSTRWNVGAQWDGKYGVGQQISALEVIQNNLIAKATQGGGSNGNTGTTPPPPLTVNTGGTSQANPNGTGSSAGLWKTLGQDFMPYWLPTYDIQAKDRVGAGFLTFALIGFIVYGLIFLMS